MEEDPVAAIEEESARASRTRCNIMDTPAADGCLLYQLDTLTPPLCAAVVAKLRQLASASESSGSECVPGFAEGALDTPDLTYVLLHIGKEPLGDVLQLSPDELRETQLSVAGGRGAAAAAGSDAIPLPERLLGFCVVHSEDLNGQLLNIIDFFDTFCPGYNLVQLMWQRMGELCCGFSSPGTHPHPTSPLALWPLPASPSNVLYWARIEQRMPQLGPGGILRVYDQLSAQTQRPGLEGPQGATTSAAAPPAAALSASTIPIIDKNTSSHVPTAAAQGSGKGTQAPGHTAQQDQQRQQQQQRLLRAAADPEAWQDLFRHFAAFCNWYLYWDKVDADAYLARTRAALVDMAAQQQQQQQVEESQPQLQQQRQRQRVQEGVGAAGVCHEPAPGGRCDAVAGGQGGGSSTPGELGVGGMGGQGRTAAGPVGPGRSGVMGGSTGVGGSVSRCASFHGLPMGGGAGYGGAVRVVRQQEVVGRGSGFRGLGVPCGQGAWLARR